MGKEKRGQRKLHAPAPSKAGKGTASSSAQDAMDVTMDDSDKASIKKAKSVAPSKATTNPFKGMKITTETLKQHLPDFDAASAVTSKSFRGLNLKKKDKQKVRRDLFMEKIDAVQKARKEKKEKRKREQTAVVGDLSGMADALPTLELLMKESSAATLAREKKEKKSKSIASEKQRQKNMMQDIKIFQQVLEVPEFKANPTKTILEHLRNKLKQEEAMDL